MKIKIKVKNILLISFATLFIILIVVPFATLEIAKYLDEKGSDKANIFYESYISRAIRIKDNDSEALYNYAVNLAGEPDKYTIMMQGWGGSGTTATIEDMNKAKEALVRILDENPKASSEDKYLGLAYSKIMELNIVNGEPVELLNWIEWGSKVRNPEFKYISDLYRAYYHYVNREYEMANKAINDYDISNPVVDRRLYLIKGDIALFQGEFDLAIRNFNLANSFNTNSSDSIFGSRSFIGREYWFNVYEDAFKGDYTIKGRVTFNGEPMPFVEVYVQDDTSFRTGGNDHVAITDINGEYETLGLRQGRYQIGIGLSNSLLYDKVYLKKNITVLDLQGDDEFDYSFGFPTKVISPKAGEVIKNDKFTVEWDEVERADFYRVELATILRNENDAASGSMRSAIPAESGEINIKGTIASFDINMLKTFPTSISFGGEDMLLGSEGVLGYFVPGEEYPIVVNAYDKEENLIGSSLPINSYYDKLSSVKVEGTLSEGEKLIQKLKYEEAIEHYTNLLVSEPNNKEALLYLSKIYMIGWKEGKKDIIKASEYASRYDELVGGNSLLFKVIGFMDNKEVRDNREFVENVLSDVPINKRNSNYFYELSRFNMSIGEFETAREAFKNSDGYIPMSILYIDLYLKDLDTALELLGREDFNPYNVNKNNLIKSIEGLKINMVNEEEYNHFKEFLKILIMNNISREYGIELLNATNLKISNPHLKNILEQIKYENHWDVN